MYPPGGHACGRSSAVWTKDRDTLDAMLEGLPEVDPWYVRRRVGDGITLVSEPHVHPMLRCNVWHIEGRDTDVVVDTSLGLRPLRPWVERELAAALLAVATHGHFDHVGAMGEFDQRAIHHDEAEAIAEAGAVFLESEVLGEEVLGPYRDAGYAIGPLLIDAVPTGGLEGLAALTEAAPATRILADGDVVDLGDRAFEVLHVPGHSPGSIALWETSTGVLFSGDAVYDGPLLGSIPGADVDRYVETLIRLRRLPVTVVHAGHEPSFGRERLVEICDEYLTRWGA